MCGLAFLADPKCTNDILERRMRNALECLVPRGPDAEGFLQNDHLFFGHRRLSIIDLGGSQQPFCSPCGRYTLVFNGEIYNYRELKEDLISKWAFVTHGDTEVLFAGLVLYGESFLSCLNGMWAFIFYDALTGEALLSRDRLGKKPLFYSGKSLTEGFYAASEIPALKCLLPFRPNIDSAGFVDYWRFGFQLGGATAYSEISELDAGCYLKVSAYECGCPEFYEVPVWASDKDSTTLKQGRYEQELYESLQKAVERRLVADVEVGCFLSGGLDSSIVALLASKRGQIRTFSMAFQDKSFDESTYANQIAKILGTKHQTYYFKDPSVEQLEKVILLRIGQPFIDTSILALDQLCFEVAKEVKVALSGDGADELFGGYERYGAARIYAVYRRLPVWIRQQFESSLRYVREGHSHHSSSFLKKLVLFTRLAREFGGSYVAPHLFGKDQLQLLLGWQQLELIGDDSWILSDPVHFMMQRDLQHYLQKDILRKVDAASMHHGLEVRCPFLDPEVIRLAHSRNGFEHRSLFRGKHLLRQVFAKDLPDWLFRRKKHGFVTPVARWFRGALGARLEQLLMEVAHPLNKEYVRVLLKEHCESKDWSSQLWAIYIYLIWLARGGES